ncbi:MAG: matrixin family metalloprotease [Planctomycetales bacterium]|nr:matrixin family metalloprotease [Planctomycetales bacterium]
MVKRRFTAALLVSVCLAGMTAAQKAKGFVPDDRWITTASGTTGSAGDPITLTWSLVPDGTSLTSEGPSNLISFMDTKFGTGPGGADLTLRPWFGFFEDSFARWTELGGITYVYEPNDDGATQGSSSSGSRGLLGVRGDIRIGAASIDGASGTLAFNYLPDNGDMVLDSDDGAFFGNSSWQHRRLRNTIMHEAGHGFGLNHVESSTSGFLLEPAISTDFDGPQFDDIRGLHWFYGDALEKTNGGQGNETAANAFSLGSISAGSSVSIGTDAVDTLVGPNDTDFVSIDRHTDVDFFSFTVAGPSVVDLLLTPLGPTYDQGSEGGAQTSIDTSAISNLALDLYDTNGSTLLASANSTAAGFAEALNAISLPTAGNYFVRITGNDEIVQFYQLDVAIQLPPTYLAADFNESGMVDAVDFGDWQEAFGVTSGADADEDLDSDGFDLLMWQQQFGGASGLQAASTAIPEPSALLLALLAGLGAAMRRMSR